MKRSPLKRSIPMRRSPMKRGRKGMNKIGPKGSANLSALAIQKVAFDEAGIVTCELGLSGCWRTEALHFAYAKKRRHCSPDDLLYLVIRSCDICHAAIEGKPSMERTVLAVIIHRESQAGYFYEASKLALAAWFHLEPEC